MGLFSSKNEIRVASVVYNMAGDERDRPQYLKSLVIRNTLANNSDTIADTLRYGYLKGPGIKFRSFFNWVMRNYDYIGVPEGRLDVMLSVPGNLIAPHISTSLGESAWVQNAEVDDADYSRWVEKWFLENAPELVDTEWEANINNETNEITINFEDNSSVNFMPEDFDKNAKYIIAYYSTVIGEQIGPIEEGELISLGSDPLPEVTDWVLESSTVTAQEADLDTVTTVVITYSDDRPEEGSVTTDTVTVPYDFTETFYTRTTYEGGLSPEEGDAITSLKEYQYQGSTKIKQNILVSLDEVVEEIEPGVFKTTTTLITEDILIDKNEYRIDTQLIIHNEWSPLKLFIYKMGSGIVDLDSRIQQVENYGKFFPMIPIRINNRFLSESFEPQAYELASRAYKKVTDSKFSRLIENIANNDNIGDIDYAYVVFGVSINVIENSCKKYIYNFFKYLMENQSGGPTIYGNYLTAQANYHNAFQIWETWKNAQYDSFEYLYGKPEPALPIRPSLPNNILRLRNTGEFNTDYDVRISWTFIREGTGTGLAKPNARKDELWFTYVGSDIINPDIYQRDDWYWTDNRISFDSKSIDTVRLYWQIDENNYKYLDVVGMIHRNYIYKGKFVEITARAGIADGEESGFIIPLHNGIYRATSLVDSTQMTTACCFIVFNCYVVKKIRWYQRGIFKIILVIVIVIASITVPGAGVGLLGSHLAVGGALGLTGMSAAIAGAVANALAAMVLTTLIEQATIQIFGEKWGALIGALISFAAFTSVMNFQKTGSFALNWGNMLKADNLLRLTDSVGRGYTSFIKANIEEMRLAHEEYIQDAQEESRRLLETYYREFGFGGSEIDPMLLVGNNSGNGPRSEDRDTFLARTLMTGSDVAEMSKDLLNNFPELSLILPDAFSH